MRRNFIIVESAEETFPFTQKSRNSRMPSSTTTSSPFLHTMAKGAHTEHKSYLSIRRKENTYLKRIEYSVDSFAPIFSLSLPLSQTDREIERQRATLSTAMLCTRFQCACLSAW